MAKKSDKAALRPPEPITTGHLLDEFTSGEATLDNWLRRRALRNEASGASRTYVVCLRANNRVVGYYSLAAGAVAHVDAPGKVRRNMPDPIPVLILGRLAVDQRHQGHGLGRGLLRDAILRCSQAAHIAGVRAILVHAISEDAKRFYESAGFRESPVDPRMLMITIAEIERAIRGDRA